MFIAIIAMTTIGVLAGLGLAVASKKFEVKKDPRIVALGEALPGTNCGACGYPGCAAMAEAIATGKAPVTACPSANDSQIEKLAEIMGVVAEKGDRHVARLFCQGDCDKSPSSAHYSGPQDCVIMSTVSGGGAACVYGCMGGGSCVKACVFDAIHLNVKGLPVVDTKKCTACGLCVKACPRNLIRVIPESKSVLVACSSKDKGADVRKICTVGCIGCRMCATKACMYEAITIENNLAEINPVRCAMCLACVDVCPTHSIVNLGDSKTKEG